MHHYQRWMDDYLDDELSHAKSRKLEKHLQGCRACTAVLSERRRLQLRLTGYSQAGNNEPEYGFVQRILDQPGRSAASIAAEPRRRPWKVWLPALSVVAALTLVGGVMSVAWFAGAAPVLASAQSPLVNTWSTSPVELGPEELEELREDGWNCPDFEAAGLTLLSATGSLHNGEPQLRMELAVDSKKVLLTESRTAAPVAPAAATAHAEAQAPTQLKTAASEPAAEPSSAAAGALGMLAELGDRLGADTGTKVEVSKGKAKLTLANATYSVESDLSRADVERILSRLVVSEHSRILSVPDTGSGTIDRLIRGLGRILVMDVKS